MSPPQTVRRLRTAGKQSTEAQASLWLLGVFERCLLTSQALAGSEKWAGFWSKNGVTPASKGLRPETGKERSAVSWHEAVPENGLRPDQKQPNPFSDPLKAVSCPNQRLWLIWPGLGLAAVVWPRARKRVGSGLVWLWTLEWGPKASAVLNFRIAFAKGPFSRGPPIPIGTDSNR